MHCYKGFQIFDDSVSSYMSEIFSPAGQIQVTRRSKNKLDKPFRKSNKGQNVLSYLGPKIWNSLNSDLKSANNVNSFKHKIKDNSSKTFILRKLVPIYFIGILKAVTKQSINNLENAAFLLLPFEITYFFSIHRTFFSFKDISGGTIMEKSRTDLFNAIPAILNWGRFK